MLSPRDTSARPRAGGPAGRGWAGAVTPLRSRGWAGPCHVGARRPRPLSAAAVSQPVRGLGAPLAPGADARALPSQQPKPAAAVRVRLKPASHHVFASRGEAGDESWTPARRESWWDANCAETPAFWRHQRREGQGRPGVGEPQSTQADRVYLWSHCPGRQGLPPSGRPGGPPEAPRLHRQTPLPKDPAYPAASQVTSEDPAPSPGTPRFPDTWYFLRQRELESSSKHCPTGKSKTKQSAPSFAFNSSSKTRIRPPILISRESWLVSPEDHHASLCALSRTY